MNFLKVSIDGERIPVRARIAALTGYSGHADRDALLAFVEASHETLERVFVVMGEPSASNFLAQRIHDFLGLEAVVPQAGSTAQLEW
jgi:metallo-beta-lactamase family protein